MENKILKISFFLIISFNTLSYSQEKFHYFAFNVSTFPIFLSNTIDTSEKEYTVLEVKNSNYLELYFRTPISFFETFILTYSEAYIDSVISISLIDVKGFCADTMNILFEPGKLKSSCNSLCNILIRNIPFTSGTVKLTFPDNFEKWANVKKDELHKLADLNEYNLSEVIFNDITEYQEWINLIRYKLVEDYKIRIIVKDEHSINFRLYEKENNLINDNNKYIVTWKFYTTYWDQGYSENELPELHYDKYNQMFILIYKKHMYKDEKFLIEIYPQKWKSRKMTIEFTPRAIIYSKCNLTDIFIDSIKFNPGNYEIVLPKYKEDWNNINTIRFEGSNKEFYNLTNLQYWIKK